MKETGENINFQKNLNKNFLRYVDAYQWKPGGDHSVELNIWDRGEKHILDRGEYSQARFYKVYGDMTELIIDGYIEGKEAEDLLNESILFNA